MAHTEKDRDEYTTRSSEHVDGVYKSAWYGTLARSAIYKDDFIEARCSI